MGGSFHLTTYTPSEFHKVCLTRAKKSCLSGDFLFPQVIHLVGPRALCFQSIHMVLSERYKPRALNCRNE